MPRTVGLKSKSIHWNRSKPVSSAEALGNAWPNKDWLKQKLLSAVNTALGKLVALDPASAERLLALDGRSVSLMLTKPSVTVGLRIQKGSFVLVPDSAEESDLSLKTSASALMQLAANRISQGANASLPAGKLHISGDAELARQMQLIAGQFDPDWDQLFTAGFGDVLGFQLARGARSFARMAVQSAQHFARSGSDYLREESKDTLAAAEVEQFLDDVDQLRDAVDRADSRLKRLYAKRLGQ